MPALVKIPLLLLSTYCVRRSLSSPNPPAKAEDRQEFAQKEKAEKRGWTIKDSLPWITHIYRRLMIAINLIEVAFILTSYLPSSTTSTIPRTLLDIRAADRVRITPTFLLGLLMVVAGTIIRITCYHRLGPNFTFELMLRSEHTLITTGPYSVVRHPGYTAGLTFMTGLLVQQMGEGSWWREVGIHDQILGRVFWITWVGIVAVVEFFLLYRTTAEDAALHRHFGEQWERWAQSTKYRLVPYVY